MTYARTVAVVLGRVYTLWVQITIMMADTESQSLKGNVVTHPSFITPYDTPTFLRAAMLRVIGGFMALAACVWWLLLRRSCGASSNRVVIRKHFQFLKT